MIEVEHLTKRYGSHTAVDDISFTVEDGGIYGLLGPNGAGKSTTMNIITGYISATDGTVKIDGHDIADEPAAAKACIGYLPELPPLYQDMTVQEYLLFVAELKGTRKKADRAAAVAHAAARAGLQGMEQRLIRNLSKGYRQRVGIAAALLGTPKIIILDEPTVGLDPAQMIEIRSLIRDLGKTHTVILSSHILSEVQTVCDRVLIIAHGRLVAQGTPEELAAQLTAKGTITATAQGSREAVVAAAGKVPGLTDLRVTDEKGGEVSFTAVSTAGTDLPPPKIPLRKPPQKKQTKRRRTAMKAIFKREVKSYFTGMIGWVVAAVSLFFLGLYYTNRNLLYASSDFASVLYTMTMILLFLLPAISMRSFAEERKNRTDQLLLTSPVSIPAIVAGKFLAEVAVFALPLAAAVLMPLILKAFGTVSLIAAYSAVLGYLLLGSACLAVGTWISALTENQILAYLATFGALLVAYIMDGIQTMFTTGNLLAFIAFMVVVLIASILVGVICKRLTAGVTVFCVGAVVLFILFRLRPAWLLTAFNAVLSALALFDPFQDIVGGMFSIPAIVYYLSVIGLFLFLTGQALERRRWN